MTPEPCQTPVNFTVDGCQDSAEVDLGDVYLESAGRIVELNLTVKNVCPHMRTALGIILTEIDCAGKEHPRGMKTVILPAHSAPSCRCLLYTSLHAEDDRSDEEYPEFDFFLFTKLEDARSLMLQILQDRNEPFRARAAAVLALAHDLQQRIDRNALFAVDSLLKDVYKRQERAQSVE